MDPFEGWRRYNCRSCQAPVKLTRKGWGASNNDRDPDQYEFDGVDLSPMECFHLVACLDAVFWNPQDETYLKLKKRSLETPQPGTRP